MDSSMTPGLERTIGLIGCGGIGRRVAQALIRGEIPGWKLGAVLGRSARTVDGVDVIAGADDFFAQPYDLVIEAAGPSALLAFGARALRQSDVWTVSGTALVNDELVLDLQSAGANSGHRLRVVPGAIGGLDGVSALTVAPDAKVHAIIDLVPSGDETVVVFNGSVRDAAAEYPNQVNVTVATALAGLGIDRTEVTVRQPKTGDPLALTIEVSSRDGSLAAITQPMVRPADGIHVVASSIIALLRTASRVIWVG
jgi:aspartate dehydrogenase